MSRLLMIADDLTGALDAGVCFAEAGISTCICQDSVFHSHQQTSDCQVLVCVAATRHLTPEAAYAAVYEIVSDGLRLGFTHFFKKTDSALRGNVGAELAAARSAAHAKRVYFVPAFPKIGRITKAGIQYIDRTTPVSQSIFGQDPFNPVRDSFVPNIIRETSGEQTTVLSDREQEWPDGILIFDAGTEEELLEIAKQIFEQPDTQVLAGCAGFAAVLPQVLDMERGSAAHMLPDGNLMIFCGSVNPISLAQCQAAQALGAPCYHLIQNGAMEDLETLSQLVADRARQEPITCFDTGSADAANGDLAAARESVARCVGRVILGAVERNAAAIPVIIGGDTLLEFLRCMRIETISPLQELLPGVVLSKYDYQNQVHFVISKSGGFGEMDFLQQLQRKLNPLAS